MNSNFLYKISTFFFIGAFLIPVSGFAVQSLGESPGLGDETTGIYGGAGLIQDDIRNGKVSMDQIPAIIVSAIEMLLVLVGTICVVAIVYHAVRMQLASGILGDSSGVDKAKKGIYSALMGFVLSMSAWFIMTKLVSIFAGIT
ncbi:MAG: hypothetical protein HHAS10_04790 [Candidatus Altimarinota bacterium]